MSTLAEDAVYASRLPRPAVARDIREAAQVTQASMAAEIGVHRVTLARWESGTCTPRGRQRVRYARLLEELRQAVSAA